MSLGIVFCGVYLLFESIYGYERMYNVYLRVMEIGDLFEISEDYFFVITNGARHTRVV